jgi:tRNA isopentenyl-2-thiomethyl-A-37 hydroxylase MiaE
MLPVLHAFWIAPVEDVARILSAEKVAEPAWAPRRYAGRIQEYVRMSAPARIAEHLKASTAVDARAQHRYAEKNQASVKMFANGESAVLQKG